MNLSRRRACVPTSARPTRKAATRAASVKACRYGVCVGAAMAAPTGFGWPVAASLLPWHAFGAPDYAPGCEVFFFAIFLAAAFFMDFFATASFAGAFLPVFVADFLAGVFARVLPPAFRV